MAASVKWLCHRRCLEPSPHFGNNAWAQRPFRPSNGKYQNPGICPRRLQKTGRIVLPRNGQVFRPPLNAQGRLSTPVQAEKGGSPQCPQASRLHRTEVGWRTTMCSSPITEASHLTFGSWTPNCICDTPVKEWVQRGGGKSLRGIFPPFSLRTFSVPLPLTLRGGPAYTGIKAVPLRCLWFLSLAQPLPPKRRGAPPVSTGIGPPKGRRAVGGGYEKSRCLLEVWGLAEA